MLFVWISFAKTNAKLVGYLAQNDSRLSVENSIFCSNKVCKVHKCIRVKINTKTLCSAKNIIGAIMICGWEKPSKRVINLCGTT